MFFSIKFSSVLIFATTTHFQHDKIIQRLLPYHTSPNSGDLHRGLVHTESYIANTLVSTQYLTDGVDWRLGRAGVGVWWCYLAFLEGEKSCFTL